jgi:polysaccharide biosynthesis/export protein
MRSWPTISFAGSVFSVLLLSLALAAQTPIEPSVPAGATPDATKATNNEPIGTITVGKRDQIRIGGGDLIEVSLYGVPDFKQELRVSESGDISLPLVGAVGVAGRTPEEAQVEIAKSLVAGGFFRDPHVSVFIKDYASQGVSVMGEVGRPGVYPMMGSRRLYDLVSAAGGFTPKAGKLVTVTHRDDPNNPDKVILSDDPAKSAQSNVEVMPGDTIVVAKAGIVYVVGDVVRPGGFVMENNERLTVLQAVALAQGVNRTAALNAARIIRRSSAGPSEVKIPLKNILAAKATDLELQPEDILFVPGSAAKGAMRRGMESVIQVATGLALYGAR